MRIRIAMNIAGADAYVNLVNQETGYVWNGATSEAYDAGNQANYAVTVTDPDNRKVYEADVPDGFPASKWDVFGYVRQGAQPDIDNDPLGGSAILDYPGASGTVVGSPLGSITGTAFHEYVVRSGLRWRNRETEVYDALLDTILELQQVHGFDEFQVEESITDAIASLGDYKMTVQPNTGKINGVVIVDGSVSYPLQQKSKAEFDRLFPAPATDQTRARPRAWCLYAGQILVGPAPDKTSYEYRQIFSSRLTTTITASTTIPLSAQYREVLKDGVLWRMFESLKNTVQADRYAGRYAAGVSRITTHERDNQDPGGDQVAYQAV